MQIIIDLIHLHTQPSPHSLMQLEYEIANIAYLLKYRLHISSSI